MLTSMNSHNLSKLMRSKK